LDRNSLTRPKEVFERCLQLQVTRFAFNPEETLGIFNSGQVESHRIEREIVERFFVSYYKLLEQNNFPHTVRELESTFQILLAKDPTFRRFANFPLGYLCVSWDGQVSTFDPTLLGQPVFDIARFYIGDVFCDSVQTLLRKPLVVRIAKEIADGIGMCRRSCTYYEACQGGASGNKYFERGNFAVAETNYCETFTKGVIDACTGILTDKILKFSTPGARNG
jgi:uncharacterized protein